MALQPTLEQKRVIEAAKTGQDLIVQALAGTGKTTTLKLLAEALSNKTGTYIAFNKAIVDEARTKFPSNVNCKTAHSLAFASVGFKYKSRIDTAQRVTFSQMANWMDAPKIAFKHGKADHQLDSDQVARLVMQSVTNFCKSVDSEISEVHVEVPFLLSLDKKQTRAFINKIIPLAQKAWTDLQQTDGFLKFSHDHYLKMWQLASPKIKGDFILFDEAQDADPVMLSIIEAQRNVQKIFCGDQYQAIYEWRGAKNALENVPANKTLWLTQSFRFGDAIADEANDILDFLDATVSVVGLPSISSRVEKLQNPSAILCRTNAGVIKHLMEELQKGRKVAVLVRTQELMDFADACGQMQKGNRSGHPELAPFQTWFEVREYSDNYPEEAQELKSMVDLVDRFGVEPLIRALKKIVPEDEAEVLISTAHKAKGREWKSVKLAGDFLHPQDMEVEDLRLAYVSVTRAIEFLDMSEWALIQPLEDRAKNGQIVSVSEDIDLANPIDGEKQRSERHGQKWSYSEDLEFVESAIKGTSISSLATKFLRSETALQARLAKWLLHVSIDVPNATSSTTSFNGEEWDDSKLDIFLDLWDSGSEIDEMAVELDVSVFRIAILIIQNDLVEIDESFLDAVEEFYS
jgi:energy-coupling factor transporter ATP-binding protein EcfA2